MEFGKLPPADLQQISFKLPDDAPLNKRVLTGTTATTFRINLGLTNWGFSQWAGNLYPPQIKEKDFLHYYSRQFNSIELNATHYKLYGAGTITKWKQASPPGFLFCPKMFKEVTHKGSLIGTKALVAEFCTAIESFDDRLGPVFIQLPETYSANRINELTEFLNYLPKTVTFFLEVRHPDWFLSSRLFDQLHALRIGAVLTDTAGRRDCAHMQLTIPKAFIRFVANDQHPTDYQRIDEWAERIRYWKNNGLLELNFFVHSPDEGKVLEIAAYAIERFNAVLEAGLKPLRLGGYTLF